MALDVLKNETDAHGNPLNIIKMPFPDPIYIDISPEDDCYTNWE